MAAGWLIALAAAVLAVALPLVLSAFRKPPPRRVLAWAREVSAGSEVVREDLVEVDASTARPRPPRDAARPALADALYGRQLGRDVARGQYVSLRDFVNARPPDTLPAAVDWRTLPTGRPEDMERQGHEAYLTQTQTARQEELDSGATEEWYGPRRRAVGAGPASSTAATASRPAASASAPAGLEELASQPWAAVGLVELKGEVPGEVFPDGAQRLSAFRQTLPDGTVDTVTALVPAPAGLIEEFYKNRLGQIGYNLAKRSDGMRPGSRTLLLLKSPRDCYYVNLHPADNGKVKVVLMIQRPAAR